MTYKEYDALPGLRATHLKKGLKSMAHMHAAVLGKIPTPSSALRFGALFHAAILEPDVFAANAAVWQGGDKRSAADAWRQFKSDHDPEWIMDVDEQAALMAMSVNVHANPDAHRLIANSRHEVVRQWQIDGVGPCKCRVDGLGPEGFIELKSTTADDKRQFFTQCERLGYFVQLGWERLAVKDETQHGWVISVQNREPYWVGVYQVPETILRDGEREAIRIARDYRTCETMGVYPGPCSGIQQFERAAWVTGEDGAIPSDEMEASEL